MRAEFVASLEGLLRDYNQQVEQLGEMHRKVSETTAVAATRDGLVKVTVDARGQVRDLRLDPRVYRRLSPPRLARTIMELINTATVDVSRQMQEIMAPFIPEGVPFEKLFGEKMDFTSFLPQPATLPDDEGADGRTNS